MAYVSSHALIASVFCFLIPFSSRIWFAWRLFSVALLNAYYAPQKCSLFFFFLVLLSSVTLEADWKGANHGSANSLVSCPVSVLLYVRRVCDDFACVRECFFVTFFFFSLLHWVHHCATLVPASSTLVCCGVSQGCHPLIIFPPLHLMPKVLLRRGCCKWQ